MQYTNRLNLPPYIVDWLLSDSYDYDPDEHTISTTTLMKPIKILHLTKRYYEELSTDVIDLAASSLGDAVHDSISQVETSGYDKETRVQKILEVDGVEWKITGKYDILQTNTDNTFSVRDIKTTSVWAKVVGKKDEEYSKQLSTYRWLLHPEKNVRDIGYIDFFFTDWSRSKAKQDKDYPQYRISPGHEIQLASLEDVEEWVISRIKLITEYEDVPDDDLPACTPEELWREPDRWAVKKPDKKRATRVLDTEKEAKEYLIEKGLIGQANIEKRPSKVKRCAYCPILATGKCKQGSYYEQQGLIDF